VAGARASVDAAGARIAELELIVAQLGEELRAADERTARVAGGVGHDLNNLMTAISGYVNAALSADDPGDQLREISRAGEHGIELCRKLMVIGRRAVTRPRVVDVGDELAGLKPVIRRLVGGRVGVDVRAPDRLRVLVDPNELSAAIANLATNAAQAMPGGGTMTVEACGDRLPWNAGAPGVRIDVSDTGEGIAPELIGRIFEPFFTTRSRGSGLGLAMVHAMVTQAGGRIHVESTVGVSTTFRIHLPAAEGDPAGEGSARGRGRLVYVARSDPMVLKITTAHLRRSGFEVVPAESGSRLLERAIRRLERPDLLIADAEFPGMSGLDLAERLSARVPGLAVLLLAWSRPDGLRPAWSWLPAKPFTSEELLAATDAALASRSSAAVDEP
jgi:two-component system, cell cycle sensor histidine kinase and response regulator CckA